MKWLLIPLGACLAWLLRELLSHIIGEALWTATGLARRPIWAAFVRARFAWPLWLMLGIGLAAVLLSLRLLQSDGWTGLLGFSLFIGGTGLALLAPLIWRDARRARVLDLDHPPNVR